MHHKCDPSGEWGQEGAKLPESPNDDITEMQAVEAAVVPSCTTRVEHTAALSENRLHWQRSTALIQDQLTHPPLIKSIKINSVLCSDVIAGVRCPEPDAFNQACSVSTVTRQRTDRGETAEAALKHLLVMACTQSASSCSQLCDRGETLSPGSVLARVKNRQHNVQRGGPADLSWIQASQERSPFPPPLPHPARPARAGPATGRPLRPRAAPSRGGEGSAATVTTVTRGSSSVRALLLSSSDSGFYNGTRELYSNQQGEEDREERDMFYWRRRGQDFSLLLDYADGRELRAAAGGLGRVEGAWRAQVAPPQEERRADRQRWDESAWLRVRDAAQGQWRAVGAATGDRKCQSLGTEEWRPALGLGRHLSDGEGKLWAQEQAYRTPAEGAVHPKTKGKSQSLPRVLSPESLQQANTPFVLSRKGTLATGSMAPPPMYLTLNTATPPYHHHYHYNSNIAGSREPWTESSSRLSHHIALLPKPRFSRPLKPPSYEAHQQTRGSAETLAGDQVPESKDGDAAVSL
ncbi:hypothetical protein SKAU_G00376150 [Synaphobranchus kaupii]|uniref:Uncharacterized protein n=1 Tax=Synaphobranchus kaupii TaxID=118154 RepID=A0A9Q1ECT1_SYNKA|nr:hypothetical protein SKAU_G00376150 [Synaphobranchus kaupii]